MSDAIVESILSSVVQEEGSFDGRGAGVDIIWTEAQK